MKINKLKIGGKSYDVGFTWQSMMIYEDETNRNISFDMADMSKMSFISRVFASGLISVERYQKKKETSFVDALGLLNGLTDSEYQAFTSNVLKWFLQSLPANEKGDKEVEEKEKKS